MIIQEGHGFYKRKKGEIHFSPSVMVANFINDDSFRDSDFLVLTKREMRLLIGHIVAEVKFGLEKERVENLQL